MSNWKFEVKFHVVETTHDGYCSDHDDTDVKEYDEIDYYSADDNLVGEFVDDDGSISYPLLSRYTNEKESCKGWCGCGTEYEAVSGKLIKIKNVKQKYYQDRFIKINKKFKKNGNPTFESIDEYVDYVEVKADDLLRYRSFKMQNKFKNYKKYVDNVYYEEVNQKRIDSGLSPFIAYDEYLQFCGRGAISTTDQSLHQYRRFKAQNSIEYFHKFCEHEKSLEIEKDRYEQTNKHRIDCGQSPFVSFYEYSQYKKNGANNIEQFRRYTAQNLIFSYRKFCDHERLIEINKSSDIQFRSIGEYHDFKDRRFSNIVHYRNWKKNPHRSNLFCRHPDNCKFGNRCKFVH